MKPILIFPCGDVTEPDCGIVGVHFDKKETIAFMNNHPYYKGEKGQKPSVVASVDIDHFYVRKFNLEKDDPDPDWECRGKYAWFQCDKTDNGAQPYTEVTIWGYGD